MHRLFLILALIAATFSAFPSSAQAAVQLTEKDVQRIVENYIKTHGSVVAASLQQHITEQNRKTAQGIVRPYNPSTGPAGAITMVEFGDYRCGYCKKVQQTVSDLHRRYKGRVNFVYKTLPILGDTSMEAATAAMAAAKQGKFWEYNEQLWKRQEFIGEKLFTDIAQEQKLDMTRFNIDRKSNQIKQQIRQDVKDAQLLGATGTPLFVIDGEVLSGAQPMEEFVRAIETHLKSGKK